MQVALTVWEGRISPLLDTARMLLVADISGRRITAIRYEPLACESALARVARLRDLGVRILICGAITELFANLIEAQGIILIPFLSGNVGEILSAYLTDDLYSGRYLMPGCDMPQR